jgi:hypothetical protein
MCSENPAMPNFFFLFKSYFRYFKKVGGYIGCLPVYLTYISYRILKFLLFISGIQIISS